MHGQDLSLRQQVIENSENRFLQLTGVDSAGDQHNPLGEIDNDASFGIRAFLLGHSVKSGSEQQSEIGSTLGSVILSAADQQLPSEQGMPRFLRDGANGDRILRVRARQW